MTASHKTVHRGMCSPSSAVAIYAIASEAQIADSLQPVLPTHAHEKAATGGRWGAGCGGRNGQVPNRDFGINTVSS